MVIIFLLLYKTQIKNTQWQILLVNICLRKNYQNVLLIVNLAVNFNRLRLIYSFQNFKENIGSLVCFCKLRPTQYWNLWVNGICSSSKRRLVSESKFHGFENSPISFISSILQCLDILFIVMLIKALHFTCITFFNSPHQGRIILLEKLLNYSRT